MKTLRTVKLTADELEYDAKHIHSLRKKLRISQGVLALTTGVSPRTVQTWEVGVNSPTGATAKLLHLIETMPVVRDRLVPV
jgi:putative transcriptional regulator